MTTQEEDVNAPRRSPVAGRVVTWVLVAAVFLGGLGVGGYFLYRALYSPSAFVARYLEYLENGQVTQALDLPGVSTNRTELHAAGINTRASDALLRQSALTPLEDITWVSEEVTDDGIAVTMSYTSNGHSGTSTFTVVQDGWLGISPRWRFAQTPLAALSLTVRGADSFIVNGFEVDRRQVAPDGAQSDPLKSVDLLVFSPGLYSVKVNSQLSESEGVAVLADKPLSRTPVDIQTKPTKELIEAVQSNVKDFLSTCAKQQVLNPTGCPFGYTVQNLLKDLPKWSIKKAPEVSLVPDGSNWGILPAGGMAHLKVDIKMIFDGSIRHVDEDVEFFIDGSVTILPDGKVSIRIATPLDG